MLAVAAAARLWPGLSGFLVYDRGLVLSGEAWRLATGSFAHFSASHFFWDALVFGAAGFLAETRGYGRFWLACALSLVFPGIVYMLFAPDVVRFGGLSGASTAAVVFLCLNEAGRESKSRRWPWIAIMALTALKIAVESALRAPVFAGGPQGAFRVLPSAHLIGFLSALLTCAVSKKDPAWALCRRKDAGVALRPGTTDNQGEK